MKYKDEISRIYDSQPENEWERMDRHRTEFAVTLRVLEEHLPNHPLKILDCGGGPGRYAIELTRRGHEVTLFDLSEGNLVLARQKVAETGVQLHGIEQGSALDLSQYPDNYFEAVLLMGPLYHLLDRDDRHKALAETYRVLTPGGKLFAAFITRFAPLKWAAANDPHWALDHPAETQAIWETGQLPPRGESEREFVAYFAHPDEVRPLIESQGFFVKTVLGLEGFVSETEDKINVLTGEAWDYWVNLNYQVACDPTIQGATEHLLAIAEKPKWRSVLRFVADRLNQLGINYHIVGGAAVALYCAAIQVKDLDIEVSAPDAYRIQDLFAEFTQNPVTFSESETYRSHYGQLKIEGQVIDIMGDLERRQGDGWVPTTTVTQNFINLGGIPVSVPWLEEAVLATMRRGKLERASLCLPHCNPEKLRLLIEGEQPTNVI